MEGEEEGEEGKSRKEREESRKGKGEIMIRKIKGENKEIERKNRKKKE